jgi:hypothetical protein
MRRLAKTERVRAFSGTAPSHSPGIRRVELGVGEATLALAPSDVPRIRFMLPA